MLGLDIKWSTPFPVKTKYGEEYRREWEIPPKYVSEFFNYWHKKSFELKDNGFGVTKKNGKWFVTETKLALFHFKEFSHLEPKVEEEEFILLPEEVKHTEGLREWQIPSVGKLSAIINKIGASIDGSDLGTGKSFVACGVARQLGMKLAIVCPKSMIHTWKRVVCNHFKMSKQLMGIINYESLRRGKEDCELASFVKDKRKRSKEFVWKIPKDTLIIWDESQKLKGAKTQNSKTCLAALKQGYKMLFCSATVATTPLEMKTVGQALKLFDNNKQWYNWLYSHGVTKGRWGLEFNNDANVLKKLNKDIFQDRGVRLTRDSIPSFPESQIIAECYDIDESDAKEIDAIYAEMKRELEKIDKQISKESKSANRLTAILRQRQRVELLKIPLIIDMVNDGLEDGMSVVVFVNFTETINVLSEKLNTKCIFDGKTPDKERQQYVDDFQADKERVILVNIQSGGAGLSLHNITGKYPRLAIISPSYSAVQMRQATGRVWRDGSKTKSLQRILFVANTVEEDVCDRVKQKLNNLDLLQDGDLEIRKGNEF